MVWPRGNSANQSSHQRTDQDGSYPLIVCMDARAKGVVLWETGKWPTKALGQPVSRSAGQSVERSSEARRGEAKRDLEGLVSRSVGLCGLQNHLSDQAWETYYVGNGIISCR